MTSSELTYDLDSDKINIAISTDTILYAPFFLAYYGGDFDDTPFGRLSVNIIGKEEDNRFVRQKLKGDAFATFCVIFGLADVAICDPSFLLYLNSIDNRKVINHEFFHDFIKILNPKIQKKLAADFSDVIAHGKDPEDEFTSDAQEDYYIKNLHSFRKLLSTKKVVGGLISKLALAVVGNKNLELETQANTYANLELFGTDPLTHPTQSQFTKNVITKFVYYPKPSTGNCFGLVYNRIYEKTANKENEQKDFGEEIEYVIQHDQEKCLAFSCDYVAIKYRMLNKSIITLKDYADNDKNYMFSGIIANDTSLTANKLKMFLYAIDKNLSIVNQFISSEYPDTIGLTKYFKTKFYAKNPKSHEILKMIVADKQCYEEIIKKIEKHHTSEPYDIDDVIAYYVESLAQWQGSVDGAGFYYTTTIPNKQHLIQIYRLRLKAYNSRDSDLSEEEKNNIDNFIATDLLKDWRHELAKINEYNKFLHSAANFQITLLTPKNGLRKWINSRFNDLIRIICYTLLFLILALPPLPLLLFIHGIREFVRKLLWVPISNPLTIYTLGSIFIALEITASIAHLVEARPFERVTHFLAIKVPYWTRTFEDGTKKLLWLNIEGKEALWIILTVFFSFSILISRKLLNLKYKEKYIYNER